MAELTVRIFTSATYPLTSNFSNLTSHLSLLDFGGFFLHLKHFQIAGDHKYRLILQQVKAAKAILRHFNVNQRAPICDGLDFHQWAGSVDVLDSCAEVIAAVGQPGNLH